MKPFVDLEAYQKSIFRLFRFPVALMVTSVVVAYIIGILMTNLGMGDMSDPIGLEGFSNAFFRGIFFSVIVFMLTRYLALNAIKGSYGLVDREPDGIFVPCMSHSHMLDLSMGNIIIKSDRLYFEPSRPFGGDLSFDYANYEGFTFELSDPRESMGLFLVTGEKYMLKVKDKVGKYVGTFVISEPEVNLPILQELLR